MIERKVCFERLDGWRINILRAEEEGFGDLVWRKKTRKCRIKFKGWDDRSGRLVLLSSSRNNVTHAACHTELLRMG